MNTCKVLHSHYIHSCILKIRVRHPPFRSTFHFGSNVPQWQRRPNHKIWLGVIIDFKKTHQNLTRSDDVCTVESVETVV